MFRGCSVKPPPLPLLRSRVVQNSPVYYGWIILLVGTFGMIMTTPGQTAGVSVFLDKIIADLGLKRSTVSLMYTLGTLGASFALPFVGRFIDRRGPRLAVIIISSLFALACIWMGFISGAVTLFIGFLLIRGLGQGSLSLVSIHIINIWFVRRRGLAVGLSGVGVAVSVAFAPLLLELLINEFGWRTAYMLLGALIAVTILPIGAWFYRGHPERFGLQPDSGFVDQEKPLVEINRTLAQAQRTITFWLFISGGFCVASLSTGLVFHHYSIMAENGVARLEAATVFIALGFIVAGANFTTGFLVDRMPPRFLLSAAQLFLVAALATATTTSGPVSLYVYGALLGLTQGMSGALGGTVYAYYFGREYIGTIKGFATTTSVAASAFGPLLFAVGFEQMGRYAPILLISAMFPLSVALLAPFIKPPGQLEAEPSAA